MRTFFALALLAAVLFGFASCSDPGTRQVNSSSTTATYGR